MGGCLLLAQVASPGDDTPMVKPAAKTAGAMANPAQSAAKAGVDEAAVAAERSAAQAAALANVEMRSPAKAAADEASVAAQVRAAEAAVRSNVELSGQTKAGVDEAAVAAQLRATEPATLSNVELSGQTKAGVDEAAVAAQLRASEAAARSNVEQRSPAKAALDEAVVAAQLRAAEVAALSNVEMRSPAKAAADEAALAEAQTAAEAAARAAATSALPPAATIVAPGVARIGPAVKPTESGPRPVARVAPFGPRLGSITHQEHVALPPLSATQLRELKKPDATSEKGRYQIGVGRVFNQPVVVNSNTAPVGAWTVLPNGWHVWFIDVTSAGALGLRVHLESLHLPDGVRVVVYDPTNPPPEVTPITAQSLAGEQEFWTESVLSDRVVIECQVPPGVDPATVSFRVTGLCHFFRPLFPKGGGEKAAEGCENDVTCYPAWASEASGVARIFFISGGNGYLCTGCLLNTVPTTFIDYFLTANHCVGDQATASTLEAWWFYQTSACNGTPPTLASAVHTTGGADLLATQTRAAGNDFSFMRLRTPAPGGTLYAGWNTASPAGADTLTTIHHPAGDYKRISFGHTTGNNANYWYLQWFSGVTEHGSSGCPLYDTGHRVIGQLWGGASDCANQSGIDEYGRFNVTYGTIAYWLYPPANDVVGGAVVLPDSLSYFSQWTTNATDDTGLTCSSSGTIYKGIWFSYTPTLTGTGIVDTCASTFDTKIEIFNSSMTSLGCNDDSCGLQSSFSFACTAGQTYYICAGGYGGASGQLQIRAHSVCASSAVPSNDQCAGAWALSDSPFYTYESTVCATDDTGLTCLGTAYKGVWFTYTPQVTGNATVDTCGSGFDTKIEVFSGACGALTSIGCNDDSCGLQSSFTFPCTAGTTYHICAGGYGGASGSLSIRAQAYCTSGTLYNDTCSSPYYLSDTLNYTTEYTACGTDDTGLPCSGTIYKGVWFYYTPTVTGTSVVDTCTSDFDTKIEVFSGSCGALTSLGCNDDACGLQSRFSFACTAGTTYRICAGGYGGHYGNLSIRAYSVCDGGAPFNDTCGTPFGLLDSQVYSWQNTLCANDDTNLPCISASTIYRGLWYTFTATATGTATVDTCGSDFDTKIVVFTNACGSLGSVGCNDDSCGLQSKVSFPCIAGTNYLICAGGYGGHAGNLQIRAYSACGGGAPVNDTCAGASYLPDSQFYSTFNTGCAMDDTNLPCTGTMYRGIWFTYTPLVSGNATVDTCGSDFDTKIAIYTGTCGALVAVGCNDDTSACGGVPTLQSSYTFPCTVGTTYYICAGGYGGHSGNLQLRAYSVCTGTPANDQCAGAITLLESHYSSQNTGCATDDGTLPYLGVNYHGVWFTCGFSNSGWAVVDTCPSDFDTKIEVFNGVCGALTSLGCNDDSPCGSPWSLQSSVGFSCTAGTTYYICAGGYGGAFGNLQIRARTTAPPNDTCGGAFALSDNVYYGENTGTATDDATGSCVSYGTIFKGVWFSYTPAHTGTLTVDTCPSGFDTKIQVFSGNCGGLTSLGCNDDACGFQSQIAVPVACGATYYICAGGWYTNVSGSLQIRAALTAARPPLSISPTVGGNVVITWPASYPCFALYYATNLPALPSDWTLAPPPPVIVSGNYSVTNSVTVSTRFYRLQ
jgi:Trypsin-like peptidase domain